MWPQIVSPHKPPVFQHMVYNTSNETHIDIDWPSSLIVCLFPLQKQQQQKTTYFYVFDTIAFLENCWFICGEVWSFPICQPHRGEQLVFHFGLVEFVVQGNLSFNNMLS